MPMRPNDGGAGLKPIVGSGPAALGPATANVTTGVSTTIPITGLDPGETITSASAGTISGASIIVNLTANANVSFTTSAGRSSTIAVTVGAGVPAKALTFSDGTPLQFSDLNYLELAA